MEFKFSSTIFKNSTEDQQRLYGDKYDPDKMYPNFTGTVLIPKGQLQDLVDYLHWAVRTELKHDGYLKDDVVPLKISGWQKESKSGKKFLSLSYTPDFQTLMQHQQTLDKAAASLAQGTAGSVVKPDQEDIF